MVKLTSVSFGDDYTENEKKLLGILLAKRQRRLTSSEIVSLHFSNGRRPINAQRSVTTVLNVLARKARVNKEKWSIHKSRRSGAKPIEWWSE